MGTRVRKKENVEIGSRLRQLRKDVHLTQVRMSKVMGVTPDHYRRIESGRCGLTIEHILFLYEYLQIDPTYLLTGKHNEGFDLKGYLANCSQNERNVFLERCFEYFSTRLNEKQFEIF